MATTLFGWRPSALPAARPSLLPTSTDIRLVRVAGLPQTHVLRVPSLPSAPAYVAGVGTLENSIGTPAAVPATAMAAEGAAMSGLPQSQRIDADKAKGFNARGNPPRGRRRV
jgi:hypothetical protein